MAKTLPGSWRVLKGKIGMIEPNSSPMFQRKNARGIKIVGWYVDTVITGDLTD
jgi:hypothetical protein